jgi:hypothetical protein
MRSVEDVLALHLRHLCEQRIAQARAELRDQRALLEALASEDPARPDGRAPLRAAAGTLAARAGAGAVARLQAMATNSTRCAPA